MSQTKTISSMRGWLPRLGQNELGLLGALVAVVLLTALLDEQRAYLHDPWGCLQDVLRQTGMLGIFALGAAIVIISGGIDLSSGSMIAFSGTICASTMVLLATDQMATAQPIGGWVILASVLSALGAGLAIGGLHAFLITKMGMPPFVATLGSLVGLRSAARVITQQVTKLTAGGSTQIYVADPSFRRATRWTFDVRETLEWLTGSTWSDSWGLRIPISTLVFIALAIVTGILMSRTVLGRHIYALGGNEAAARLSGIQTGRLKWFVYSLSAVLCSIAGIFYIGDQGVAAPEQLARGYELNAIAAAVVGGCSLQGGSGTITGTVLGVLFLRSVIDAVAKIIDVGADLYEGMIVGVVVILAVAVSRLRR